MDKSFISRKWVQMEVCLRFKNFNQIVVCILIFTEPRPVQTFSDWSSEMKSYTASSLKRLKINLASTTSPFSINYKIRQFRNLSRDLINNINELQSFSPTKLKLSWCFATVCMLNSSCGKTSATILTAQNSFLAVKLPVSYRY